jgi:hypothetical protein
MVYRARDSTFQRNPTLYDDLQLQLQRHGPGYLPPIFQKPPSRESAPENDGKIHLKAASQKGTRIAKKLVKQGLREQ